MTTPDDPAGTAIEYLYDVAIDPTSYERMLDFWEEMARGSPDEVSSSGGKFQSALADLSKHLGRADKVLAQTLQAPPDETAISAVGKMQRAATFAINASSRLVCVNAAAVQTLGMTAGARAADLPFEESDIERLLAETGRMLRRNAAARGIVCARTRATQRLVVVQLRLFRPVNDEAFILCVTSEIAWPAGFADQLQEAFSLSTTEIDLLRHLAEGHSVKDIADLRSRSLETVRVQVKSLLAKTGTRSQLELVRLALTTVEMLHDTEDELPTDAVTPAYVETQSLKLKDGRTLEYQCIGDPKGRSVLFLPMDFGFVRWPPAVEAEARRRHLRVIVPVRPGYGRSSALPPYCHCLNQLAADHLDLLDHLKVARAPILSLGDDSLLAIWLHDHAPHRFSAIFACAGTMPLTTRAQLDRMGKWHRFVIGAARYTPQLLPFVVKAGAAMARRVGKRQFFETIYAVSPADTATFALPDVRETLLQSSDVTLSDSFSAHEAFARELAAKATVDWTKPLEVLRSAAQRGLVVRFFNGEQDPQIPPETLREFQDDFGFVDFRTYPDAGQLVFYLKWRDVLGALEDHLGT